MKNVGRRTSAVATLAVLALAAVAPALRIVSAAAGPAPVTITGAFTTAYTWFDNTPPGTSSICCPQIHQKAGGTGTYADPITLAVGHSTASGRDVLDYPPGTRFFVYDVRRYFIVEDSCGDSSPPQSGGCHSLANAPPGATTWVDMWAGGAASDTQAAAQACTSRLTDGDGSLHTIVENPPADLPVVAGPLFQNGQCTALYGNGPPAGNPPAPSTPTPAPNPTSQPPVAVIPAAVQPPASAPPMPVEAAPSAVPSPEMAVIPTSSPEPSPSASISPKTPPHKPVPTPGIPAAPIYFLVMVFGGTGTWLLWRRRSSAN